MHFILPLSRRHFRVAPASILLLVLMAKGAAPAGPEDRSSASTRTTGVHGAGVEQRAPHGAQATVKGTVSSGSVNDASFAIPCVFDRDCDDCSRCTVDRCWGGVCLNTPRQMCESCYDEVFCNGSEICDGDGNCAPGAGDPCGGSSGEVCDEDSGPFQTGSCVHPCVIDADCNDLSDCTGTEICVPRECVRGSNAGATCTSNADCDTATGGYCGGVCRSPDPPCGTAKACWEDYCDAGSNHGAPCSTHADCGFGGHCQVGADCVVNGRCCTDDGTGGYLLCTRSSKPDCDAAGGRWLFVGDDPRTEADEAICTYPAPPTAPNADEHFGCPAYSAGIAPVGTYIASIGPITLATCEAIHELGDDYVFAGADAGNDFIVATTIRYVGGFDADGIQGDPSRVRISFYDQAGTPTARVLSESVFDGKTRLRTVVVTDGPVIPARGWMTITPSVRFSPFGRHHWMSTDAVDTGANDDTQLWLNGAPVSASAVLPTGTRGLLAFEIVGNIVPSPVGACCNAGKGICSELLPWDCESAGGLFLGTAAPACDPVPSVCATSACCDSLTGSCTEVAGAACNDTGEPCLTNADCGTALCQPPCPAATISQGFGTNCDPNACVQPELTGHDTCTEASLPENLLFLDVASLTDCEPQTVTISGDNLVATLNDNPGSCETGIFHPTGSTQDRGWWHAFETHACANVRIDFCTTQQRTGQAKQPIWASLWNTCDPCSTTVASTVIGAADDGGCVGTQDASEGIAAPFCAGDDAWATFGPLPPGTYWYPVHSAPGGTWGPYQMHITASACPIAACCLPQSLCVNADGSLADDGLGNPIPCANSTACTAATCQFCAELDELDCDAVSGKWNGFGSTRAQCPRGTCESGTCLGGEHDGVGCDPSGGEPATSCLTGVCDIGSCCVGPGDCDDRADPQTPCNIADPATCMSRAQCETTPTGAFTGGTGCNDPLPPCTACDLVGRNNCQYPLGYGFTYMSDLTAPGSAVVAADDFVPNGDTLTQLCVWGTYMDASAPGQPGDQGYEQFSCVGMVSDHFRVRVFQSADFWGDTGRPGILIGESEVTGANIAMGPEPNTTFESTFGIVMQGYTLTLDTPITGLVPGERHWLEVANNTAAPEDNTCFWHWAQHMPTDRDAQSASGFSPKGSSADDILARPSVYIAGSERGGADLAFCLGGPSGPLGIAVPPADTAACWTCGNGADLPQCSIKTLRQCTLAVGVWDREDPTCANYEPPSQPNDYCRLSGATDKVEAAPETCGDGVLDPGEQCDDGNLDPSDGCGADCLLECGPGIIWPWPPWIEDDLYAFDNACATIDGPSVVRGEGADFAMDGDIWFEYTSTCTGLLVASMCATQSGWTQDGYVGNDGALALYHEDVTRCDGGTNDGHECVCPGNPPGNRCVVPNQCPGTDICVSPNWPPGCSNEVIGLCKNHCPCPGLYYGVSPLQDGDGSEEGCNGITDAGSGYIERVVFPNECYTIRVGSWMSVGSGEGTANRGRGFLDLSCEYTPCFPSSPAEPELGPDIGTPPDMVPWNRPRMISFEGGDAGHSQAVRVTFKQMPTGWESWEGQSLFVQEPWLGSEVPGESFYDPPAPGDPAIQLAELECTPHFRDWSSLGVVYVLHPAITPSRLVIVGPPHLYALYDIRIIDETCSLHLESHYSDPLEVRTAGWADMVELDGGTYRVPGDLVSVVDTLAMVAKFAGAPGAPSKASMSLLGVTAGPEPKLDGKITISETVSVLNAFGGANYPFLPSHTTPPPGPCPP